MEFVLKYVFYFEFEFCKSIFEKFGSDVFFFCFVKIIIKLGFFEFFMFGNKVMKVKKDVIKFFKLLDIFAVLDRLRLDFNKLFGLNLCQEI